MREICSKIEVQKDTKIDDMKNDMDNLIERWFELHREEVSYEELVELAKEQIETRIGDIVENHPELEENIPSPICWR